MWTPTHVQVTVQRAKGLLCKGKNGTNDVFVTIALGKEKYQTSVKERATDPVEWHEECELPIPKQGNKAEVVLTTLHRNFIGDEFLGQISIPLSDFDVYEKPRNKWYQLQSKPGKEKKNKERGELEVRIGFTVRTAGAGSLSDLSKKDSLRSSFGQLSNKASSIGGSLLSLRGKEKKGGLKNLAKAVGHKVSTLPGRGRKKHGEDQFGTIPEQQVYTGKKQSHEDADPGVISDDEDEFRFDELSHKSSHSSLSVSQVALSTPKDGSLENLGGGEFLRRNYNTPPPGKPPKTPTTTTVPETSRWSTGPIDEWDAKLFGKQNNFSSNKLSSQDNLSPSPLNDRKLPEEPTTKDEEPKSLSPKQEPPADGVKALLFSASSVFKEPVPKPRQIQEINKEESKPQKEPVVQEAEKKELKKEEKVSREIEKPREKEKSKHSTKETFASLFASKPTVSKDLDDTHSSKGTPVGITSPMKKETPDFRIPREAIRRFDGKSREDLIEMVLGLQATVDYQKQKLNDMEDYIDNLIVRVMENKPTLLQSPFVTCRPMK